MSYDFAIAMIPDTQKYAVDFGTGFTAMCQWIVDNAAALNIQMVMHVGDIVASADVAAQWTYMATGRDLLAAAGIPTLWAIGNHDYDGEDYVGRLTTAFDAWLPEAWYTGAGWWAGGFYDSPTEHNNLYYTVTIGAVDWIVLVLECIPRDAVITWADGILTANATRQAIVLTHAELTATNMRSEGRLWHNCLKLHDNVVMCLCGHVGGDGGGFVAEATGLGNTINEIMADYTQIGDGREQWMRVIRVKQTERRCWMDAYSPSLALYRTHPDHSREFSW